MVTVLTLLAQVPLDTVQVKIFAPTAKPLTVVVAEFELLKVKPAPVQVPVPTVGTVAPKVAVVKQSVWLLPALDTEGLASLLIVTLLVEGVQLPLDIVQVKTFAPTVKPVTPEAGEVGFVIVAPDVVVHIPEPTRAALPPKIVLSAHNV